MATKIPSLITEIKLNEASYKGTNTTITNLTYVNFFFGNNGVGKSTIAKAIQNCTGLTSAPNKNGTEYLPLVFNQEFIDKNFHSYHDMPGVFTINEINQTILEQIETKEKELKDTQTDKNITTINRDKKQNDIDELKTEFQNECWNDTEELRKEFDKTQDGKKRIKPFAEAVKSATPVDTNLSELRRLYDSVYSDTAKAYSEFTTATEFSDLDCMDGIALLNKAIVNTADTPFAEFLNKIKATEWVTEGHEKYSESAEKQCPYCQQFLPDNFEEILSTSFDTQYQENIQSLKELKEEYRRKANEIFIPLSEIPTEVYPQIDTKPFDEKLSAIKNAIQLNIELISKKIDEPSTKLMIENVSPLFLDVNKLITEFNKLIKANNEIVALGPKKKKDCEVTVLSYFAFKLKDKIKAYKKSENELEKEKNELETEIKKQDNLLKQIKSDLKTLSTQTVETDSAMDSINLLLRDTGFQGFQLKPKTDSKHVYQVVRLDGSVATNLSEGEKNFIAFLYFYHLVRGSENSDGETREKIVVIDDPVSSMDSHTLFMVSTLVHEMIEVCRNNANNRDKTVEGNFIKQIFIMTHNAYFHREITNGYVSKFEYVSFYLIRKLNNLSSIKYCVAQNPKSPSDQMNINPVKNTYAALWDEYKADLTAVPLISVIRRILEHYFIQLCGYEGSNLSQLILKDNKHYFVDENGNEDLEKFHTASAMLSYISATQIGLSDDLHYVDDSLNVNECRETFQMLFTIMNQDQHYNKMMS